LRDQLKAFFGDPDRLRSDPESPLDRAIAPREGFAGVSEGSNLRSMPLAQQQASMAAFYKPVWQVIDVEVALDRDGTLLGAWIITSSGSRRLDRYALEQVKHVAAERPEPLPRSARLRYRLRASYVAKIPTSVSLRFDETGNLDRRASGARRYIDVDNPAEDVQTDVQLLSIDDGRAKEVAAH
jgi:TonB family protein